MGRGSSKGRSNHYTVTGKSGRAYGGLKYAPGTYDTIMNDRDKGIVKGQKSGYITTYEGVPFGVEKVYDGNTYNQKVAGYDITHIPTGLKAGSAKTLTEASSQIKDIYKQVKAQENKLNTDFNRFVKQRKIKW